jgi:hypothetical protein
MLPVKKAQIAFQVVCMVLRFNKIPVSSGSRDFIAQNSGTKSPVVS